MADSARQALSLDGDWDIVLDEDNRGLSEGWGEAGLPAGLKTTSIHVPGVWQELFPDYDGVTWYRRRFAAPPAWQSQRTAITFGAANFTAAVWLNGRLLGNHVGGYTPFTLDASRAMRVGQDNDLLVRVADCGIDKDVDGYRLNQIPCAKEIWYHNFSGLYQPVMVEATSHVYIHDVFAYWGKDHLDVRFEVENTAQASVLSLWHVALSDAGAAVAEDNGTLLDCRPGVHTISLRLPVANAHLWSPDDPHLYRLRVQTSGGMGGSGAVETRIGLRTIGVRAGHLILNGQAWRPKMILYQPHYPATLAYPPSDDYVRQEMRLIKQAGFDMVRFHLKPPPPLYLDLADEMGLTVYAETALGWIRHSDRIDEHFEREITETIRRDRNHASIVVWGIINENRREVERARSFLPLARRLDPSRPAIDNCGQFSMWDGGGWLSQSHVAEWGRPRNWPDLHIYIRSPLTQDAYDWLNGVGGATADPGVLGYGDAGANRDWLASLGDKPSPIFVSEYGVGALPDLDAVVAGYAPDQRQGRDAADQASLRESLWRLMREHKLTDVYPTIAALADAEGQNMAEGIHWQTEALRANPQATGFGLLQFNDASWEIGAGLVDQRRQPKPAYAAAAAVNAPVLLAMTGHLRNVLCGSDANLRCVLVNDKRLTGPATLRWQVLDPAGSSGRGVLHNVRLNGKQVQTLPALSISPRQEGCYTLESSLWRGAEVLCRAQARLFAWEEPAQRPLPPETVGNPRAGLWLVQPGRTGAEQMAPVLGQVRNGDVALFLELWEADAEKLNQIGLLPFALDLRAAPSSWLGYLHYAHAHPVFAGLPAPGLLGRQEYNEVLPRRSLIGLPGECVVVGLSSTGIERARLSRVQPEFWAGSDLQVIPYVLGRLIFSQFLLRETVGRDPVADRLFSNLLRFGLSLVDRDGA
jgi:hypothetical protein